MNESSNQIVIAGLWLLISGYTLFLYAPVMAQIVLSSDISILVNFASRMLDGMKLSEGYYETNPPLNMMIFVPVVWASRVFDIAVYDVQKLYTVLILAISFGLSSLIMRRFELIDAQTRHLLLMILVMGLVMIPGQDFGDRDHLIITVLVPFILVQYALAKDIKISAFIALPALILGTIGVLVKPHYGLIPTVFLLMRLWERRNLSILKDPDFLSLSAGVLIYVAIVFAFFSDFIDVVLFDVIKLYLPYKNPIVWPESIAYAVITVLCYMASQEVKTVKKQDRHIVSLLCLTTLLLLVPYFVQGKGLDYHRIPFLLLCLASCCVTAFVILRSQKYVHEMIALSIAISLGLFLIFAFRGLPHKPMTHDKFRSLPLYQVLNKHCPDGCSYLMFYDYSEFIHQLAIYNDSFHASRFTSQWFLPLILDEEHRREKNDETNMSDEELAALKNKYLGMFGEDMKRFQPDYILHFDDYRNFGYDPLNFLDYFSYDPAFAEQTKLYEAVDTITFDRMIYYEGFITDFMDAPPIGFTIYKRMENGN